MGQKSPSSEVLTLRSPKSIPPLELQRAPQREFDTLRKRASSPGKRSAGQVGLNFERLLAGQRQPRGSGLGSVILCKPGRVFRSLIFTLFCFQITGTA